MHKTKCAAYAPVERPLDVELVLNIIALKGAAAMIWPCRPILRLLCDNPSYRLQQKG